MALSDKETKEYEAALLELTALGRIEFKDDDYFCLTEKGIERAAEVMNKLPLIDRILLIMSNNEMVNGSPFEPEENTDEGEENGTDT